MSSVVMIVISSAIVFFVNHSYFSFPVHLQGPNQSFFFCMTHKPAVPYRLDPSVIIPVYSYNFTVTFPVVVNIQAIVITIIIPVYCVSFSIIVKVIIIVIELSKACGSNECGYSKGNDLFHNCKFKL